MFDYIKRKIQLNHFNKQAPRAFESFYESTVGSHAYLDFCKTIHELDFSVQNNMSIKQKNKLLELIEQLSPADILDLGCGQGLFSEYLADKFKANVTGVDFVSKSSDKINFIKENIETAKLSNNNYDLILSIDSLYMISDMKGLLVKSMDSLRPEGKFIILYSSVGDVNKSQLVKTIKKLKLNFEILDYRDDDLMFWRACEDSINSLNEAFHDEGKGQLWKTKNSEILRNIELHKSSKIDRSIIIISNGNSHE